MQTMDDFEEAVEMGYLEKFLRQDHDMAETSQTIGEDELDKLMREMTDADLDTLVDHLSVDDINEAELADLGASTPPSRSADLPSASSSTSGLFSGAAAGAGIGAAGAAATAAAIDASPAKADVKSTPTKPDTDSADKGTPTKSLNSPTQEKEAGGGLLASVGAAVSELSQKASEAVHGVEEKLEGLAAEPASVAAAREELEEGTSPLAETKAEPPVESDSRTARELVEADKKEAASPGPLPNEPTLDELIDTTLAKESLEAEKKEAADEAEGAKERARLLAETKESEAAIHAADSATAAAPSEPSAATKAAEQDDKLAEAEKSATADAAASVESSVHAADADAGAGAAAKEPTLDALIDKTMAKEHAEYEAQKAQEAKAAAVAETQKGEQAVHASDAAAAAAEAAKKTE